MSDLAFNKIAGAVLATGLVILGLKELSSAVYAPEPAEKAGYAIAVQEEAAEGGAAQADTPPDWGTVLPAANVTAGEEQSKKCISCHTFTNGGTNGTGPNNWGVVGRKPGGHPGFAYSTAMTEFAAKHPAWNYDELYEFLKAPSAYMPGTKMTFVGVKAPEDRINLIAWLRQQASAPAPIPAPNPKAAAPAESAAPAASSAPAVGTASSANTPAQTPKSGAAAAPSEVKPNPGNAPG